MATAAELASFQNRSGGAVSLPVPVFELSELPAKIARIDPAGAKAWRDENNAAIAEWVNSQNGINTDISTAITTKH